MKASAITGAIPPGEDGEAYIPQARIRPLAAAAALTVASRYGVTGQEAMRGALRLLAAAQQLRRAGVAWDLESEPDALDVPDLTCGLASWPHSCGARKVVYSSNPAYLFPRVFVCTRVAEHTGRHAAGAAGRITAVWAGAR